MWASERTMRDTSSTALSIRVGQSDKGDVVPLVGRGCLSVIVLTCFARGADRNREAQDCGEHHWPRGALIENRSDQAAQSASHQGSADRVTLNKMIGMELVRGPFDLGVDLGQSLPKILTRFVSLILIFGNLFFRCH